MSISNLLLLIPPSPCNEISQEQGQRWHARNKNIIGAGVIWGRVSCLRNLAPSVKWLGPLAWLCGEFCGAGWQDSSWVSTIAENSQGLWETNLCVPSSQGLIRRSLDLSPEASALVSYSLTGFLVTREQLPACFWCLLTCSKDLHPPGESTLTILPRWEEESVFLHVC